MINDDNTTTDLRFRGAVEADLDRLADVLSHAFGFPTDDAKPWFARAKLENVRVLEQRSAGSRIIGGLLEIPMGQWFGGASVSTMGVAGVGIAPEARGRGAAAHLMLSMLREARERGFAISTLFPATISLYRRVGYERAGARFAISFDPRSCNISRATESETMTIAEVLPAGPARALEEPPTEIIDFYNAYARRCPGYLDRGPYVWNRIVKPRGLVTKTFTTTAPDGAIEGYVVLSHATKDGLATMATVIDMAATTSRAARSLLRFLVEYRSLAETVKWHGGPSDVFTNLLPERHVGITLVDYFMVRILDVRRALTMRGWPVGSTGSLALEVVDRAMPENNGCYVLSLENGIASVSATKTHLARVKLTERGLAALYTGYAQAHVLAQCGWLEADDATQAQLDAWFGGAFPTMRDGF